MFSVVVTIIGWTGVTGSVDVCGACIVSIGCLP
jgi:hypothetical protein